MAIIVRGEVSGDELTVIEDCLAGEFGLDWGGELEVALTKTGRGAYWVEATLNRRAITVGDPERRPLPTPGEPEDHSRFVAAALRVCGMPVLFTWGLFHEAEADRLRRARDLDEELELIVLPRGFNQRLLTRAEDLWPPMSVRALRLLPNRDERVWWLSWGDERAEKRLGFDSVRAGAELLRLVDSTPWPHRG